MRYVNEAGKWVLGAASALMLGFALLLSAQTVPAQIETTGPCGYGEELMCDMHLPCSDCDFEYEYQVIIRLPSPF